MLVNEYIIQDRSLATKWALKVNNGEFYWTASTDAASPEPIFEDTSNPGTNYKVLIDNGELAWEVTATVQNDEIILIDTSTSKRYKMGVSLGQFFIELQVPASVTPGAYYSVEIRDRNFDLVKILTKKVKSLKWEYSRIGGCGRCTLAVPMGYKDLDKIIYPDYDIQIKLANEDNTAARTVYRGYAESHKPKAMGSDQISLQFSGYMGQLKRVRVNKTYTNEDVNAIVKDILDTFVVPDTSITYDNADIAAPGFIVDSLEFDTMADSAISTLAELARFAEFGVDENRKFFFKARDESIRHYARFKVNVKVLDIINDYSRIVNRIVLKGGNSLEETINNTESQSLFGLRTQITSNTAIVSSGVGQQYGTTILLDKARINRRSTLQIINNRKFFEEITPIGKISIITGQIGGSTKYNDPEAIYGADIRYSGQTSYQINKIKYALTARSTNVSMDIGESRPDIANDIKRLEFQLQEIRNQ